MDVVKKKNKKKSVGKEDAEEGKWLAVATPMRENNLLDSNKITFLDSVAQLYKMLKILMQKKLWKDVLNS